MTNRWSEFRWALKKFVSVQTTHHVLQGYVHAVDPETGNIILLDDGDGSDQALMHIVFAGSVQRLDAQALDVDNERKVPTLALFKPRVEAEVVDTDAGVHGKQLSCETVVKLLTDHRIDATVTSDKSIRVFDGLAEITSPYTPKFVRTDNEIVMSRIRNLLRQHMNHS